MVGVSDARTGKTADGLSKKTAVLECPDLRPYILDMTLTTWSHPLFQDIPGIRYAEVHCNHIPQSAILQLSISRGRDA